MRIEERTNDFAYSNTVGIKAHVGNARAIIAMLANIYENPALAFIREMACNAYDAHVMADNLDKSFDLHFPTKDNPNLIIRDYGTGLSKEFMETRYTSVGDSTKKNSDDEIGGFGIGRLSFLSVTEMAIVTSYYEGMKYAYNVSRDENLDLCFFPMGEEETDEPNGLEIIFTPTQDVIYKTIEASKDFFKRFKMMPNLTGAVVPLVSMDYAFENEKWGVRNGPSYENQLNVVMGGVAYPVNRTLAGNDIFSGVENLIESNIDLFFNISDIQLAPSREGVMQTDDTLKKIASRLNEIKDYYLESYRDGLSKINFLHEKKIFFSKFIVGLPNGVNSLIRSIARKEDCGDLTEISVKFQPHRMKLKQFYETRKLDKAGNVVRDSNDEPVMETKSRIVDGDYAYRFHEKSSYRTRSWNTAHRWDKSTTSMIKINSELLHRQKFILMDIEDRSWKATIEHNYGDDDGVRAIYMGKRQSDFKAILKHMTKFGFKPSQFTRLSELEKKPRVRKLLNGRNFRRNNISDSTSGSFSSYSEVPFTSISESDVVFVETNRHEVVCQESIEALRDARFAHAVGLLKNFSVYAVSKSYLSMVPDNWINIVDYMSEIDLRSMKKLIKSQYRSMVICEGLKSISYKFKPTEDTDVPYKDEHGHVKILAVREYESKHMKFLRMGKNLSVNMLNDLEFLYERHKNVRDMFKETNVEVSDARECLDLTKSKMSANNILDQNYAFSKIQGFLGSDVHNFLSSKKDPIAFIVKVNNFVRGH